MVSRLHQKPAELDLNCFKNRVFDFEKTLQNRTEQNFIDIKLRPLTGSIRA